MTAIDGFWFEPEAEPSGARPEGLFEAFYDRSARASLPGWRYFDTEPIVALFAEAGFSRVTVAWLEEVHRVASTTDMTPGTQQIQVVVADAEAARRHLLDAGVEASDVDAQPWGKFVYIRDPDGNRWSL